jgi:hypothetical protein
MVGWHPHYLHRAIHVEEMSQIMSAHAEDIVVAEVTLLNLDNVRLFAFGSDPH